MREKPAARPAYSEYAAHYEALFGQPDVACVALVEASLAAPALLLDAGCGTGAYASILASRGYRVAAADRALQMLRAGRSGAGAVDFVLADLRRLPFKTCFDVVLARGVLNDFVEERGLREALRSMAAALRDGGMFIADVRERAAHRLRISRQPVVERSSADLVFRASRRMDDKGMVISVEQFALHGVWSKPFKFTMRTFTEEEIRDAWPEAGLDVLEVKPSYGPGSRLSDRLVIVAQRRPAALGSSPGD
jgi:SAM-dependent methyltransferase